MNLASKQFSLLQVATDPQGSLEHSKSKLMSQTPKLIFRKGLIKEKKREFCFQIWGGRERERGRRPMLYRYEFTITLQSRVLLPSEPLLPKQPSLEDCITSQISRQALDTDLLSPSCNLPFRLASCINGTSHLMSLIFYSFVSHFSLTNVSRFLL